MVRTIAMLVAIASLAVGTTNPALAVSSETPTPASCAFDPALNGTGFAVIDPADGFQTDRVTFDAQGRLYLNLYRVVDDHHVEDRIRRYLPDGRVDVTWGVNGVVDLPGEMFAFGSRSLAVDDLGRLWFVRASYLNVLTVERFLGDGTRDSSLPLIEMHLPLAEWDWVGDMVSNGDGVVLAYGNFDGSVGSLALNRITSDGTMIQEGPQHVWPGVEPRVLDVTADGWVAGVAVLSDGSRRSMVWSRRNRGSDPYVSDEPSIFFGIRSLGSTATAYGSPSGDQEAGALVRSVTWDPNLDAYVSSKGTTTTGTSVGGVAHLGADGAVIGFGGTPEDLTLYSGRLGADFGVTIEHSKPGIAQSLAPIGVRELADGSTMVAGWHDYQGRKMFIARLAPRFMGPPVRDFSLTDQVGRLYRAYFLRDPDQSGLDYWRAQRAAGLSLAEVSNRFSRSPEFIDRYGHLTDQQFVELIYENVLGRPGETPGVTFWTIELHEGRRTRGQVMMGFSESEEFIASTATVAPHLDHDGSVYRLYSAYFGREPDLGGLCYWSRRMTGGYSLAAVSDSFARSAEFQETYGSLTDQAFVELVYQNVLGRPGDAVGVAFWTARLQSGALTRGEMMMSFSESAEFVLATGTIPN